MNRPTQEAMRNAAIYQAHSRRDRTGDTITVYLKNNTWYVRNDVEGRPDGSKIVAIILGGQHA